MLGETQSLSRGMKDEETQPDPQGRDRICAYSVLPSTLWSLTVCLSQINLLHFGVL